MNLERKLIMSNELLKIEDLYVNAEDKEILKGINLKINKGEIHVIMGPNGSGKTTTANAILNNPVYTKQSGKIEFNGYCLTNVTIPAIIQLNIIFGTINIQKLINAVCFTRSNTSMYEFPLTSPVA